MRPRLLRKGLSTQIDAFAAPAEPAKAPPAKPRKELRQPALGSLTEPQELWLGVHLPQLQSVDERRSKKIIERLATSAQRFTPRVSLAPPDGLLLEVKGSLNLFEGVEGLRSAVAGLHQAAGLSAVLAFAPTPLAALARARANQTEAVMSRAHLIGHLASLALASLRWPEKVLERLARIGVYTIGQALRLPRGGFARRFGLAQLASLDRLTGRTADPQVPFQPRERFRRRRDLNYELEDQALILKALEPLFRELEKFLQVRQCGITWLECRLEHRRAPSTLCLLRLAAPSADAQRLSLLLGEKLLALVLPEPVRTCVLRTSLIVPRALFSSGIWQPGEHGGEVSREPGELIESLRARLGDAAVQGLQLLSEHRPEKRSVSIQALPHSTGQGPRPLLPCEEGEGLSGDIFHEPLWLLPAPKLLSECGDVRLAGRLQQIEAGWWDEGHVARDYFTALDAQGVRLWIFRERNEPHRWFLHGMFG
jgi:protein ImuB